MMTITDSIRATEEVKRAPNVRELTIAPLLAEAMRRISEESSVSSLFD
jgi:ribose-phosphate pyrophosphokinase